MKTSLVALACLLAGCATAPAHPDTMASRVSRLVEQTTSKSTEQAAFAGLAALGAPAVPCLVGHLDDMRPLPEHAISLANASPGAFEGSRHYAPETVHDALSAILNQITGQHFVFVYNGATVQERLANAEQWRAWCVAHFPARAHACRAR